MSTFTVSLQHIKTISSWDPLLFVARPVTSAEFLVDCYGFRVIWSWTNVSFELGRAWRCNHHAALHLEFEFIVSYNFLSWPLLTMVTQCLKLLVIVIAATKTLIIVIVATKTLITQECTVQVRNEWVQPQSRNNTKARVAISWNKTWSTIVLWNCCISSGKESSA